MRAGGQRRLPAVSQSTPPRLEPSCHLRRSGASEERGLREDERGRGTGWLKLREESGARVLKLRHAPSGPTVLNGESAEHRELGLLAAGELPVPRLLKRRMGRARAAWGR